MLPLALRVFTRTAFLLSTAAIVSVSCSRQGEGDRCDYEWAGPDQDCQSDLICTPCGNLQEGAVDRCCRRDGVVTDPRCTRAASQSDLTCSSHKNIPTTSGVGGSSNGGQGGEPAQEGTGETTSTGGSSNQTPVGTSGQSGGGNAGGPNGQ